LQEFEVVENLRCAEHHAAQWVVGDALAATFFLLMMAGGGRRGLVERK